MARTSTAKTTTVDETAKANANLEKENSELKAQIAEMMAMIKDLQVNQQTQQTASNTVVLQDELRRRVTITSITTGGVNLKTNDTGMAKPFRLERFGQTIPIVYEDLMDCINTDRWIFEEGLVYINDKKAIEEQYLEDAYTKFLTADQIRTILDLDDKTIAQMVSNSTREIQETIVRLICEKINKGEAINLNKVKVVGESCTPPVKIMEVAERLAV